MKKKMYDYLSICIAKLDSNIPLKFILKSDSLQGKKTHCWIFDQWSLWHWKNVATKVSAKTIFQRMVGKEKWLLMKVALLTNNKFWLRIQHSLKHKLTKAFTWPCMYTLINIIRHTDYIKSGKNKEACYIVWVTGKLSDWFSYHIFTSSEHYHSKQALPNGIY